MFSKFILHRSSSFACRLLFHHSNSYIWHTTKSHGHAPGDLAGWKNVKTETIVACIESTSAKLKGPHLLIVQVGQPDVCMIIAEHCASVVYTPDARTCTQNECCCRRRHSRRDDAAAIVAAAIAACAPDNHTRTKARAYRACLHNRRCRFRRI